MIGCQIASASVGAASRPVIFGDQPSLNIIDEYRRGCIAYRLEHPMMVSIVTIGRADSVYRTASHIVLSIVNIGAAVPIIGQITGGIIGCVRRLKLIRRCVERV